jgi:hypothetical protein
VQDKAGAAGNVDIPALLTQIQSLDPQVREQGFNALLQAGNNGSTDAITYPVPLQVANLLTAYPDQATNIRSEFIRLLEREIAYAQGVPEAVGLSEEYVGYQADVTAAVASLKDVRSINGLVAAIDTGGLATNTLSGFGASALDSVIAALNNDDSTARNGAAITLSHLHVADPLAMEKLRLGLLKAANDPDPFVRRTADEGLTGLNLNAIDDPPLFVAQHYRDFLGREPDQAGLPFWTGEITSCGGNSQCADVKRVNVSAAFYLSMEFQQTGYLIYRIYKASFGNLADIPNAPVPIKREEFLPDTQEIGNGVIVNQGNWQQELESNKQAFILEFVQRPRFVTAFPTTMTPAQFVDKLFANAGVSPTAIDRNAAIAEFGSATTSADVTARSRALRDVAENATLNTREFNKAFVLMQYFGYLRRNPYDPPEASLDYSGFNFWLGKLNQFGGNYIDAEMVKAFISSDEYRHRFGR